ncbi:TonB-dependent receptor [uncultured Paludibaculum sp.]|uniref:TonB-dependent receptor n=1 Tax=uncultured Paludibaculum sp. TaxID=1765020 RepID=UPI002AABB2D2|nr:TonB-dependent receptor [uncultured Paludibaculum sp.]
MCLALVTLLAGIAIGQETTGSISGQVTDASGAAIPNAKVDVTGGSLPQPITVTSDATGLFQLSNVPAGVYTVNATAQGFSMVKKTSVPVNLGRATRVDFKMEVGQVTESVVINADVVMVDTSSSSSAINVDKTFFDLIPKGRSFYDLVNLAPGARDEGKAGGYQVDGASGSENTFYLDGMEVTNVQTGVLSSQNKIPVEMVQQVQVKNGVMEAQYGGAMGGVVNAVVRSGSNDFHGQVGFYYNNDSMSARLRPTLEMDPFDASRQKIRYFQNSLDDFSTWNPVFSVGGPMIKNKLFFFSGYMPTTTTTNRTVTFNSNNQTSTFTNKARQHYLSNKVDYVPFSKLRMNASWIWNPTYNRGNLPARQGTDDPNRNWAGLGDYTAGNIISGQVDYLATSKLIISFRGGYSYYNNTNRYALSDTTYIYSTANTMFSGLPSNLTVTSLGWVQQGTPRQDYNIYKRVNLNADASYMGNWKGQHNIKFGWQTNRLSNSVANLSYPAGYYRFYWDQAYSCVTTQCTGQQRGTYGYYRWYTYGDNGDASSDNQGLFVQDNWRVNKHLTLNLGLRMEREFLPSFAKLGLAAAPPIEFNWGKKISPRVGGAWDPKGDGKMRLYASFGYFYDVMKYEMPRGSFGGALYVTNFYTIDDPQVFNQLKTYGYPKDPSKLPGRFLESVDWRIPSNDPQSCEKQGLSCTGMTIDKDLKPMKQRMLDIGYDYSFSSTLVGSARYTNRRLIRTIEDVGTLGAGGEVYYIANPGYGLTVDPNTWEAGFPVTPKAIRNYDALEFRIDKRFAKNYQFAASYTWSRSYGNYSGLASSDEPDTSGVGRTAPNVNRYFDLPWIGYTEQGTMAEGRLATDRPHTFKFFGGYTLKSLLGNTTISPNIQLYSGVPLTSQINAISTVPVYPYGRGDLGRTPVFYNFDMNLMHDFAPFKSHEAMRLRFEFTVFNLFNSSIVTNKYTDMLHDDYGQLQFAHDADIFKGFNTLQLMKAQNRLLDPQYNLASNFQGPRTARLQLSFFF